MNTNYIKITVRQLWRSRHFTVLNMLGLAIGISACWMVFRIPAVQLQDQGFGRLQQVSEEGGEPLVVERPDKTRETRRSYFTLLPYKWLVSGPKIALADPNNAVPTEKGAECCAEIADDADWQV